MSRHSRRGGVFNDCSAGCPSGAATTMATIKLSESVQISGFKKGWNKPMTVALNWEARHFWPPPQKSTAATISRVGGFSSFTHIGRTRTSRSTFIIRTITRHVHQTFSPTYSASPVTTFDIKTGVARRCRLTRLGRISRLSRLSTLSSIFLPILRTIRTTRGKSQYTAYDTYQLE
jgi:hypothetical protein